MIEIDERIIDEIYEAAAIPELWPRVLDHISTIPGAVGGVMFATDLRDTKWISSQSLAGHTEQFIASGWAAKNTRPQRLAALRHAGFATDLDTYTMEELEREPVYVEVFRKIGLGWAAGTMFPMPSGDFIVFSFERAYERGPVEREAIEALDRVRPHLARAGLLAWRLGLRRAQEMAQALETIGLPAAVLRGNGRVYAANPLFESLMPNVAQDRQQRLSFVDRSADALLAQALARLAMHVDAAGVQSIPLAAKYDQPPMVAHVLPVRGLAQDLFFLATTIVIVTPVDRAAVPNAEVLEGLFDLTPAEARVARAIAEGKIVSEIAADGLVSEVTIRSHVKSVLAKTGLHRQAQLVALLMGSSLPTTRSE